ncbi:NRAMP (natural resistance-associated macrophage protein)-like metal ion transporter [Curtobacterium sp. AG1037]|uniref:NRAMP family divalent metal transporter n=1 Tax=Curtobacterium sp. AG1037 TaxID=2183990 RepID=UPI000E0C7187|nr:NRAMP family divalent metal transporter [Curtobacterium sp. AG1037]RDH96890.1 NRAMP (natural resistance-associated macrophage protein)-like metal ion transporter [Curtobacterium sp. AG1037]
MTTAPDTRPTAVLDSAHLGDIQGAFGTIRVDDTARRTGLRRKLRTLVAIVGPGLIVMVGDNDAGAFGTYTQAGQDDGTSLLWTLLLLVPVLYVNQEMVLRLGAVTGVGHAKLITARFGRFWGAFSVVDLFVLNAMTIVTEFIGISLGLRYLGLPEVPGVVAAAVLVIAAVSTGSFRRFERLCMVLIAGSLVLVPLSFLAHPAAGAVVHGFLVPGFPRGADLSTVMLLVIGIVGTTVAPWQLFFQQSYVIDKRITPRFMGYEKVDLVIGIVIVVLGGAILMTVPAAVFGGHAGAGHFTDAGGVAVGIGHAVGHLAGVLFAIALIDASVIGAAAVGLSTSYALGDVLGMRHSLHRSVRDAKGFYAVFAGVLALAAAVVLVPGSPLGLITVGVQVLAGVLLPSATVFLLLLCTDRAVLGPWVNGRWLTLFTAAVVAVLVVLSLVLTVSVVFPAITSAQVTDVLLGGAALSVAVGLAFLVRTQRGRSGAVSGTRTGGGPVGGAVAGLEARVTSATDRASWRMPPVEQLPAPQLSPGRRLGLTALRVYLVVAVVLVVVRVVQLALGH